LETDAQLMKAVEFIKKELGIINWGFMLGLWFFLAC
jgi:hypothetical protein